MYNVVCVIGYGYVANEQLDLMLQVHDMVVFFYSLLFFILVSPLIQLSLFCVSYGTDLEDLKVYVTNLGTAQPSNVLYCYVFLVYPFLCIPYCLPMVLKT